MNYDDGEGHTDKMNNDDGEGHTDKMNNDDGEGHSDKMNNDDGEGHTDRERRAKIEDTPSNDNIIVTPHYSGHNCGAITNSSQSRVNLEENITISDDIYVSKPFSKLLQPQP